MTCDVNSGLLGDSVAPFAGTPLFIPTAGKDGK